jgi:hypothetical protein
MGKLKYKDEMDLLFPKIQGIFYPKIMQLDNNTIRMINENLDFKDYVWTGKVWKEEAFLVPSDFLDANYSLFLSRIPKLNFKIGA